MIIIEHGVPAGVINEHIFQLSDPLDLGIDDDQHDYDSVASDEDTDSELTAQNNNNTQRSNRAKVEHLTTHCVLWKANVHPATCTERSTSHLCTC